MPTPDLNGNGLQDIQFLSRDYDSVYTKPDNTQNKAYLANLTATHKVSDVLTLSGNAFYHDIDTDTYNGDINDDSLGEALVPAVCGRARSADSCRLHRFPDERRNAGQHAVSVVALYRQHPHQRGAEREVQRPDQPRQHAQHEAGVSVQATLASTIGGRENRFTFGGALLDSKAHFTAVVAFRFSHA